MLGPLARPFVKPFIQHIARPIGRHIIPAVAKTPGAVKAIVYTGCFVVAGNSVVGWTLKIRQGWPLPPAPPPPDPTPAATPVIPPVEPEAREEMSRELEPAYV